MSFRQKVKYIALLLFIFFFFNICFIITDNFCFQQKVQKEKKKFHSNMNLCCLKEGGGYPQMSPMAEYKY